MKKYFNATLTINYIIFGILSICAAYCIYFEKEVSSKLISGIVIVGFICIFQELQLKNINKK